MKNLAISFFSYLSLTLSAQQSSISGIVSIHNSEYETGKRQYVQNAQVEDEFQKANAQTTNANGLFKLTFVKVEEKTSVNLLVKKEGLQVVNLDALTAVTGQRETVRLSMAKPEKIAEYRRQIYSVGKTQAETNLAAQLKKKSAAIELLQKDAQKNVVAIAQLQNEYAELDKYAKNIEQQAQDLARRYAPINLDDAAPLYREAFGYFQKGDFEEALQILRGADLIGQADKILAERKIIGSVRTEIDNRDLAQQQRTRDLSQVLVLKADLHSSRWELDSMAYCLDLTIELDSTNTAILIRLAAFNILSNKVQKATTLFNKVLTLTKTKSDSVTSLNNLGVIYLLTGEMKKGQAVLEQAQYLSEQYSEKSTTDALESLAVNQLLVGGYYAQLDNLDKAEKAFFDGIKTFNRLAKSDKTYAINAIFVRSSLGTLYTRLKKDDYDKTEMFLKDILDSLKVYEYLDEEVFTHFGAYQVYVSLSDIMFAKKRYQETDSFCLQALNAIEKMRIKDLPYFNFSIAQMNNKLGLSAKEQRNYVKAEACFNKTIAIYTSLAKNTPATYDPSLGEAYFNLGLTFTAKNELDKAIEAYNEALTIRRILDKTNPKTYKSDVANTLGNLASAYHSNKNVIKAKAFYQEALAMYQELAKQNQELNEPSIAYIQHWLGNIYGQELQYDLAKDAFLSAIKSYKKLVVVEPQIYELQMAAAQDLLGFTYFVQNKCLEAEQTLKEVLDIREKWMYINPTLNTGNWLGTYKLLNDNY